MALSVPGKWLWDSWYARDAGLWHAFFLQADRALGDPDLRHFNVTQGHATSNDQSRTVAVLRQAILVVPRPQPSFNPIGQR